MTVEILCTLVGALIGILTFWGIQKSKAHIDGTQDGEIITDLKWIKTELKEIKQQLTEVNLYTMKERVSSLEKQIENNRQDIKDIYGKINKIGGH